MALYLLKRWWLWWYIIWWYELFGMYIRSDMIFYIRDILYSDKCCSDMILLCILILKIINMKRIVIYQWRKNLKYRNIKSRKAAYGENIDDNVNNEKYENMKKAISKMKIMKMKSEGENVK